MDQGWSICLFIALGGSAYAAATITGKQVKNNSLTGADLRNGSLTARDLRRGVPPAAGQSAPGPHGPQGVPGERGPQGERGPAGQDGAGAIPIAVTLEKGASEFAPVDGGPWTLTVQCSDREGRPQVQIFGETDDGAEGTLAWAGIRSHSADGDFITSGRSVMNGPARARQPLGARRRWGRREPRPALPLGCGDRPVSLHMLADDGGSGTCTVARTAIHS